MDYDRLFRVADRARGPHDASLFDINEKYGDVVDLDHVLRYRGSLPAGPIDPAPQHVSTTLSEAEAPA